MLNLVSKNEYIPRSFEFSEGFRDGLKRIVGLTSCERSKDEWIALLTIFRWVTKDLERKVESFSKDAPKLRIVEDMPESGVRSFRRV